MSFRDTLLLSIIGFAIGFVIQTIISSHKNKSQPSSSNIVTILENLISGFVSYVLTLIILNSYSIQSEIKQINEKNIARFTPYGSAKTYIDSLKDDEKAFYNLKIEDIDDVLNNMSQKDIILSREDIFAFWEKGFKSTESNKEVLATNIVSPKDWDYFGQNGDGNLVQNDALNRGVLIKRVMIMCKNKENNDDLLKLGSFQMLNRINVKQIDISRFDEPKIQKFLNEIGNTKDFVVFGDKYVLLTFLDEKFKIKRAIFSTNPKKVNAAIQVYNWVWRNANKLDDGLNKP